MVVVSVVSILNATQKRLSVLLGDPGSVRLI